MWTQKPAPVLVTIRENVCTNGWAIHNYGPPYPLDHYTGGHFCDRDAGHPGRCRCFCGATTRTKSVRVRPDAGGR